MRPGEQGEQGCGPDPTSKTHCKGCSRPLPRRARLQHCRSPDPQAQARAGRGRPGSAASRAASSPRSFPSLLPPGLACPTARAAASGWGWGCWEGPEKAGQPRLRTVPSHPGRGQKLLSDRSGHPSIPASLLARGRVAGAPPWGSRSHWGAQALGSGDPLPLGVTFSGSPGTPGLPSSTTVSPAPWDPRSPRQPRSEGAHTGGRPVAAAGAVPRRAPGGVGVGVRVGRRGERPRGRLEPESQPPC